MACGPDTWVTVLCRKLRDWWHWVIVILTFWHLVTSHCLKLDMNFWLLSQVAEGELPIVADHG